MTACKGSKWIPVWPQMTKLTSIDLMSCVVEDSLPLFASLPFASTLKSLDLFETGVKTLPPIEDLKELKALTYLSLTDCRGESGKNDMFVSHSVVEVLSFWPNITTLSIGHCP